MINYLQLPVHFDAAQMLLEVEAISTVWNAHFNKGIYKGNWSGISLRAPGGSMSNLLAENLTGHQAFMDTPLMEQCPYIAQILSTFKCELTAVRLLKLERGSVVHEHTDPGLNFEEGEVRFHIPICTHEAVAFYLSGDRLDMQAGTCWYINASLPHRLANNSPVHRIHLVIDGVVNEWIKEWFNRTDLPVKKISDVSAAQEERQRQVIAELRISGSPHALQLADNLELQLANPTVHLNTETDPADPLPCIVDFIRSKGIDVTFRDLDEPGFLPGIAIEQGRIVVDMNQLQYPGDLLHEAGHIAVVPLSERHTLNADTLGKRPDSPAEEMAAMAWSYAAARALDLDEEVVFHADGYKGGSESLLQSFRSPMPIGVPMLQYYGMTRQRNRSGKDPDARSYPAMIEWTRD